MLLRHTTYVLRIEEKEGDTSRMADALGSVSARVRGSPTGEAQREVSRTGRTLASDCEKRRGSPPRKAAPGVRLGEPVLAKVGHIRHNAAYHP